MMADDQEQDELSLSQEHKRSVSGQLDDNVITPISRYGVSYMMILTFYVMRGVTATVIECVVNRVHRMPCSEHAYCV